MKTECWLDAPNTIKIRFDDDSTYVLDRHSAEILVAILNACIESDVCVEANQSR